MAARAHKQTADSGPYQAAPVEGAIPRISVEAFCETSNFSDTVEEAARDRRMVKASVVVQMGGMEAAIDRYFDTETPNLLVVEIADAGADIFMRLEELAEVCSPTTKVLVAGGSNDVTLYRELIRQGVQDYVVTPAAPMQIIDAVGAIYADEEAAPRARTIGFVGVKGGVGSSTLSHNIAYHLSKIGGREVTLVDLDVEFGTAALDFNIEPSRSIFDALRAADELDDVKLRRLLVDQSDQLKLLAAPSNLDVEIDIDAAAALSLVDVVRQSTDIAVFDIPHGWEAWRRAVLLQMDELVLVATPDLTSLRNLKNMYEALSARRPNDIAPKIVLNQRAISKMRPEIPVKEFADILGAEPDLLIDYDGRLFGAAANGGQMLAEVAPSARVVTDVRGFADTVSARAVFGRPAKSTKRKRGFSMFKKKR